MLVNDPRMPGPLVDAVVLVVRIGQTTTSAVKEAVKLLCLHKAPLIGTVPNGIISLVDN